LTQESKGFSGKAADIWAMGVTFYAFVFYRLPFSTTSQNPIDLFDQIEKK